LSISLPVVNLKNIKIREENAIMDREQTLGKDVSNFAQGIFDWLTKSQIPCVWKGDTIIVKKTLKF
jgi:hypothetical protein